MEKLSAFISESGQSQRDAAKMLAISASYLSEILSGEKEPGIDLALRIEVATGGAVPLEAWPKFACLSHRDPSLRAS